MKLYGTFLYQGSEARKGIKDPSKTYCEAAFLDGLDQLRCTVDQDLFDKVLPGIKPLTDCKCEFNLNTVYNTLRLVGISPVK